MSAVQFRPPAPRPEWTLDGATSWIEFPSSSRIRSRPRQGSTRRCASACRKCGVSRTQAPEREGLAPGNPAANPSWLGNRNSLARWRALRRVPVGSSRFVKGGVPPFTHSPPIRPAPNQGFAATFFFSAARTAWNAGFSRHHGPQARTRFSRQQEEWRAGLERRLQPARGPQARRARRAVLPHGGVWSAGLRPASRGSAKPALMALHYGNGRAAVCALGGARFRLAALGAAGQRPALQAGVSSGHGALRAWRPGVPYRSFWVAVVRTAWPSISA